MRYRGVNSGTHVVVSIFFNISIVFEILNMLKISKFNCIIGFDNQYFNRNLGIILNHREFIDCTGPMNYMRTLRSVKNELLFIQIFKKCPQLEKMESDKTTEVPKQLFTTKSYYGQIQIIKWGGGFL